MKKQVFHSRLNDVINQCNVWLQKKSHWPMLLKGSPGCGKTNFIKEYLNSLDIDYVFCTVPDDGSYRKEVANKLESFNSALQDAIDTNEYLMDQDKFAEKHGKELKELESLDCPYVVIDESQHFFSEFEKGVEILQHEKTALQVTEEIAIPYNRLILISHKGLGKNNSENTRLTGITVPSPSRSEIVEVLTENLGFSLSKAKWAAAHSKSNFRSAIDIAESYGTPAQKGYLPRGLDQTDVDVLWYYFRTDPNVKFANVPEAEKLISGTNALHNCAAYLGLDSNPVKASEANLKEEKLLSVGSQSKRMISTNPDYFKLVLAILKFSGKFANPETEKPKQEPKAQTVKEKAKPKTAKQISKAKPKQAQTSAKQAKPKTAKQAKPKQASVSESYNQFRNSIDIPVDKLETIGE